MSEIVLFLFSEHAFALLASVLLLCCSATFSGCETSLFSLDTSELNRIRVGRTYIDRVLLELHGNLKSLLPVILFCNMAVNVLIFATASSITASTTNRFGGGVVFAVSLTALFLVVFFGEVFPKQLAIASSTLVARLTAVPVWIIFRLLRRPMRFLNGIVAALERIVDPGRPDSMELREEELRLLVELSRSDGVISEGEYELIDGIVELPEVRIRDIMIPFIDVHHLPCGADLATALSEARRGRHCKMPVMDAEIDDAVGWIDARDILVAVEGDPTRDAGTVDDYVRGFQFFSEHDRADQVLERIKGGGGDLFAVVDERGRIIGFFTLQDIMDEVLGHFGEHGAPPPTDIREENGRFIITGRLSVREWRELFDVSTSIPRSATLGGLIVSLLGRTARPGDVVRLENMEMTVLSTWHHRVAEVALRLIQPASDTEERRL